MTEKYHQPSWCYSDSGFLLSQAFVSISKQDLRECKGFELGKTKISIFWVVNDQNDQKYGKYLTRIVWNEPLKHILQT